jgi:hypothetical protein
VLNPWQAIGQLGVFVLMIYFADASVTAWRRGRRARRSSSAVRSLSSCWRA